MHRTWRFDHMDAGEAAFFTRELEMIRAATYDIKYPNLQGRELVPVDNSVPSGAELVTYRTFDRHGQAAYISDEGTDLPRAEVSGTETGSKVWSIGMSYGFTLQEVRGALMAGRPLESRRAEAARRAIEELIDEGIWLGNSAHGLLGIANQSAALTYTTPVGAYGDTEWTNTTGVKTPDEIVTDLNGVVFRVVDFTNDVERPDTLLLPLSRYNLISSLRMGDGSDNTVLRHFLQNNPYIRSVVPSYKLESAGSGSSKRMIAYVRSPSHLQAVIPQEFEQLPPQTIGLRTTIPCHARFGGVQVYYPKSICYADNI